MDLRKRLVKEWPQCLYIYILRFLFSIDLISVRPHKKAVAGSRTARLNAGDLLLVFICNMSYRLAGAQSINKFK